VHKVIPLVVISILLFYSNPNPSNAELPFTTDEIGKYLIIASGAVNAMGTMTVGVGQATNTNNFELGANKAPVPSTSGFYTGNGGGGGPDLAGNVRDLPANAAPVFIGIGGEGNIAITSSDGVFNLQDVGVFADPTIGIQTAQSLPGSDAGTSNSFFNDPNEYPNTFDGSDGIKIDANGAASSTTAMESTRIDLDGTPGSAGVTDNFDFTSLLDELFGPIGAKMTIPGLPATATLDVSSGIGSGPSPGEIKDTDHTIFLGPGLNVIDVVTGGGIDFKLDYANLVIQGGENDFAIFRIPDDANFLISNSNILIGNGGIGLNNVVFYTDRADNNSHFGFSNTVINGVAFWSLAMTGGEINIDNSQGCTQLIADKVNLSDVRFNRCAPDGDRMVGGSGHIIDNTSLLVTGAQLSASWMIPLLVTAVGIGLFVITYKKE